MKTLMEMVGLEETDLERYPDQLSGGMAQKFLLAKCYGTDTGNGDFR